MLPMLRQLQMHPLKKLIRPPSPRSQDVVGIGHLLRIQCSGRQLQMQNLHLRWQRVLLRCLMV